MAQPLVARRELELELLERGDVERDAEDDFAIGGVALPIDMTTQPTGTAIGLHDAAFELDDLGVLEAGGEDFAHLAALLRVHHFQPLLQAQAGHGTAQAQQSSRRTGEFQRLPVGGEPELAGTGSAESALEILEPLPQRCG